MWLVVSLDKRNRVTEIWEEQKQHFLSNQTVAINSLPRLEGAAFSDPFSVEWDVEFDFIHNPCPEDLFFATSQMDASDGEVRGQINFYRGEHFTEALERKPTS